MLKRFFKFGLFITNILVVILFLIGALAAYFSPETFLFPAYLGIAFPYLALLNFIFIVIWIFRRKRYVWLSVFAAFAGWGQYQSIAQFNFATAKTDGTPLKIITHNIRAFGLNGPRFEKETGRKIFKFYSNTQADIYCFQEFFNTKNFNFFPLDSMIAATQLPYQHIEYSVHFRGNDFGLATFSKYPIISKGVVPVAQQGTNMCIYTDVEIENRIYRIYNFHLASIHFKESEYRYIEEIQNKNQEEHIKAASNLFTLLGGAFERRALQVETIKKHMNSSPYPVIVCGDFNDTPHSYAYHTIKKGMKDTFNQKGFGLGNTYNGNLPPLRIDFVMVPENFSTLKHLVIKENLSDHYPVLTHVLPT